MSVGQLLSFDPGDQQGLGLGINNLPACYWFVWKLIDKLPAGYWIKIVSITYPDDWNIIQVGIKSLKP
jgi:hypothetical protein